MNAKIYFMTEVVGSHPNILKIIGAVDDQARKFNLKFNLYIGHGSVCFFSDINRLPNVIRVLKLLNWCRHAPNGTNVDLHSYCGSLLLTVCLRTESNYLICLRNG